MAYATKHGMCRDSYLRKPFESSLERGTVYGCRSHKQKIFHLKKDNFLLLFYLKKTL